MYSDYTDTAREDYVSYYQFYTAILPIQFGRRDKKSDYDPEFCSIYSNFIDYE